MCKIFGIGKKKSRPNERDSSVCIAPACGSVARYDFQVWSFKLVTPEREAWNLDDRTIAHLSRIGVIGVEP